MRNYPWAAVGIAFGVGFLIVPRRHRETPPAIRYVTDQAKAAVAEAPQAVEPAKKKGKGILKTVVGLAAPFVLRSAQGYALQFFEQYLAQKMAQQQSPFADLAASFMPSGAPQPGGPSQAPPPGYPS